MSLLRIAVLIFISIVFPGTSCTNRMHRQISMNDYTSLPTLLANSQQPLKFKTKLKIYKVSLSGILVAKKIMEEYRISFINEFGVKYFDARIGVTEIEMLYCIKQLDKKIFTNILLHDLAVLFLPSSGENISEKPYQLGKYSYAYIQNDSITKQINEYKKNKIISTFSRTNDGEITVEHTMPEMSLNLKPI
jgi:hypothetical protein